MGQKDGEVKVGDTMLFDPDRKYAPCPPRGMEMKGAVNFPTPLSVVDMVVSIRGLPFEKPGHYAFQILADGDLIGERRIEALLISLPQDSQIQGP